MQLLQNHSFTEKDLIGHALAGDKAAFSQLVTANQKALLTQVIRELRPPSRHHAFDIAQQALTDICSQLATLDRNRPFIDSLMDAARAYAGAQQKNPEITFSVIKESGSAEDNRKVADAESEAEGATGIITTQEAKAALETLVIMEKMKESRHASGVSYLFDICAKGHSIAQIAHDQKISPATVERAIERACTALHPQLSPIMKPLMH